MFKISKDARMFEIHQKIPVPPEILISIVNFNKAGPTRKTGSIHFLD
jgi:hypothetical protein